jgi:hypothetical protein
MIDRMPDQRLSCDRISLDNDRFYRDIRRSLDDCVRAGHGLQRPDDGLDRRALPSLFALQVGAI